MNSPHKVVGNLRFTDDGVYADYLLSGLPFTFLSREHQELVAAEHTELWRTLPSGSSISGLTATIPTSQVAVRMLAAHRDLKVVGAALAPQLANRPNKTSVDTWIGHCRVWEPVIAAHQPRRRIYWLTVPLEYGASGRTRTGMGAARLRNAAGVEQAPISHYQTLATEIVSAIPASFDPRPATTEQIWWHWNYTASRGVWNDPLPTKPFDPNAELAGSLFAPVWFDESAAALRGRKWRAARADTDVYVRTYREPPTPDSYQAFLPLDSFPAAGIAWPRTGMFKLLDDHTYPATVLDWTINVTFDEAERAVDEAHTVIKNVADQYKQRGRRAHYDDELPRILASGKELAGELKHGSERGVNAAIVIVAAAPNAARLNELVTAVVRKYRKADVGSQRWKGSQTYLWRAFNPGTERRAFLREFRNPTTAKRFARFVPLTTARLGNSVGAPLGISMTSHGLRDIVLSDFLHCSERDNEMVLAVCGSPGRGKSTCVKNLYWSWLKLGATVHVFDPTDAREHQRALAGYENLVVVDLTRPMFSLDGLRIFNHSEAAERTVDILLPQLGYAADSQQAHRLKAHLAPASREVNGIRSTNALIRYLRDLQPRHPVDDDLLIGLEGLRTDRLLSALFDETLPAPDLESAQCVLWSFAGLPKLPTVTEHHEAHLHKSTTPGQRAAVALYALGADYAQSLAFNNPLRPDVIVVEECEAWTNSPAGQKTANVVITQGRKAWTGLVGVSQHPIQTFGPLRHEFISQRLCLAFKDPGIAAQTLQWCGRDLDRHPELLRDYIENTSPMTLAEGDSINTSYGRVTPGREGEAWYLDEFGRFGKLKTFTPPTQTMRDAFETNPTRLRELT